MRLVRHDLTKGDTHSRESLQCMPWGTHAIGAKVHTEPWRLSSARRRSGPSSTGSSTAAEALPLRAPGRVSGGAPVRARGCSGRAHGPRCAGLPLARLAPVRSREAAPQSAAGAGEVAGVAPRLRLPCHTLGMLASRKRGRSQRSASLAARSSMTGAQWFRRNERRSAVESSLAAKVSSAYAVATGIQWVAGPVGALPSNALRSSEGLRLMIAGSIISEVAPQP